MLYKLYSVHYPISGRTDEKMLISHQDYLRIQKIEDENQQKAEMTLLTNNHGWFTDKSPLFKAMGTGILILGNEQTPCLIEQIN